MDNIKQKIIKLRAADYSYNEIAELLDISKNTVQSICRRMGIKSPKKETGTRREKPVLNLCKNCGEPFDNSWHRKGKAFCSEQCRVQWWNRIRSGNPS